MTNFEKFRDDLLKEVTDEVIGWNIGVMKGKPIPCTYIECENCDFNNGSCDKQLIEWLYEEYQEPKVDWSEVEIDTPVLVGNDEKTIWTKRYFAKYDENTNKVYTWLYGATSWSAESNASPWKYAKLAEDK